MKEFSILLLIVTLLFALAACENNPTEPGDSQQYDAQINITVDDVMNANASNHEESGDYSWDSTNVTTIVLNGNTITISGPGVTVDDNIATITSGGDYMISGTLNDGRIIVDSDDDQTVRLILNNVDITSTTNAPISVGGAEKTVIILADNTHNYVTDPSTYVFDDPEEDEPNAAIFSKDDLSIYGNGSLTVDANYNDGIASKDGLVINSGTIDIDAVDDGIRGKDYLVVKTGSIMINAGGDALKSDEDEDEDKGYILVESGDINITCEADGFDAETDVLIRDGTFTVRTGGGSGVTPGESSAKGIKGGKWVVIDNGTFDIDASDDAIHSNSGIAINTGAYTIATGDDAIHADDSLGINDGSIDIENCVEGIESNMIVVEGGTIRVVASDDAINSTAGTDVEFDDGSCTYLYGGYIVLTATGGDGMDSNGDIVMTGGTVIIHGPSNDPEVMFDYNGTFDISGGLLVASGSSSHMTQPPSSSSSQSSLTIIFDSSITASTLFHLEDSDGNNIVTFQPAHRYQSIAFSSSDLIDGETYTVYLGGTSTGESTDGLYSGGTYSGGTQIGTVTVSTFTVSGPLTMIQK